ncbi:hypothetical protein ASD04_07045 [Devosia sp. Root436]|uniref:hypothetical protein n=1 Tax=Devosia sp. Root436 TaxID=1736537 RepID=UPI00070221C6|nr:hypothetical protein [Devosia sp. Root436]KQX40379.1 hypothetical protein ASD04_07045 [Devosia sp. Root436]
MRNQSSRKPADGQVDPSMDKDPSAYSALLYALRIAFHPAMPVIVLMLVLCLAGCGTLTPIMPS